MSWKGDIRVIIAQKGEVVLELKNFTRKGVFENVNLKVHAGEILGMAGLVGAGRSEVMKSLVGYDPLDTGEIYLDDNKYRSDILMMRSDIILSWLLRTEKNLD